MYDVDVYIDDHADDVECFMLLPRWIMLINAELNVPMDDIHVYIVAQVDDYDGDLNVHMFMFILSIVQLCRSCRLQTTSETLQLQVDSKKFYINR